MAKKELSFIIKVDDSPNPQDNNTLKEVRSSLSSLCIDEQEQCKSKSKCLSPLSANAPHSITWSSNLSTSSSHSQAGGGGGHSTRLFHPQLSNSFSGITGLTAALNQNTPISKRDVNCSKASLNSLANSSEGSLCVHAPSLPALEGYRELDISGNISQCQLDDISTKALEDCLLTSISCPSLITVGSVPTSSSSRRLLVLPNVPRANSTFNMPADDGTPADQATAGRGAVSSSSKRVRNFNQKTLFGNNYFHDQCCQVIGKASLSPYLIRKTIKNRQTASSGNASPSIALPSNYKRKCEDWLGGSGENS